MNKIALSSVILELHVPNFQEVESFYSKLGFEKVWEYPPERQGGYLVMKRGNNILAFFCGNKEVYNHPYFKKFSKNTVRGYGVEVAIYIEDVGIEKYYRQAIEKLGTKSIVQPLTTKPWGKKDFRMTDPFGYYLCFRGPDNILHK